MPKCFDRGEFRCLESPVMHQISNFLFSFVSLLSRLRSSLCMRIFFSLQSFFSAQWNVDVDTFYLPVNVARVHCLLLFVTIGIPRLPIPDSAVYRTIIWFGQMLAVRMAMELLAWWKVMGGDHWTHCNGVCRMKTIDDRKYRWQWHLHT